MISIAHISDVHLPLPPISLSELFSKRITGYINWNLKRKKNMQPTTLLNLVKDLQQKEPDLIVHTGDLVNLSTKKEFIQAQKWIKNLGAAKKVCTIAGNHDAYIKGSLEKFYQAMGEYIRGEMIDNNPFPFIRRLGYVAIINCNSAIASPPFFANGKFDEEQGKRLAAFLDITKREGYFRIVTIHHPPFRQEADKKRKGLLGAEIFRQIIEQYGAELILHGHTHRSTINSIKGPPSGLNGAEVPVIGVASASAHAGSGGDPGRYNLFQIEKSANKFSCIMREYGYQRIGDDINMRLKMQIY